MVSAVGYSEMKESGIPWVGLIPADWSVFPAGGVFKEVKKKNTENKYTNPFSFRYGEIVDKKIVGKIDENIEETLSAYRVVLPNTIMLNGLNLNYDFISQRVAIVKKIGIITSAYLALQPDESIICPRFVLYLLKAYDFKQVLHGIGSGIRKTLKYQEFKSIKIIAPTLEIQQGIVAYLDSVCADIDSAVAEAKASMKGYKLLKQSIITQAVTKGLDPSSKTVNSGIKRIGTVPVNWNIGRMKWYISSISSGLSAITGDTSYGESGKYVLRTSAVSTGTFKPDEVKEVFMKAIDRLICPVEKDTLIMSRMNTASMVGYCAYVGDDYPNYYLPDKLWKIRTNENLLSKFAWYLLNSQVSHDWFASIATGTSQSMLNISLGDLYNLVVAIPPIKEQQEILSHLDSQIDLIDGLIAEKEAVVTDLEAYKKSLIFEVVTGKRKVV